MNASQLLQKVKGLLAAHPDVQAALKNVETVAYDVLKGIVNSELQAIAGPAIGGLVAPILGGLEDTAAGALGIVPATGEGLADTLEPALMQVLAGGKPTGAATQAATDAGPISSARNIAPALLAGRSPLRQPIQLTTPAK